MSCPNCNAQMAADQRYCLNCGARGENARLPFVDVLRSGPDTQLVPYGQALSAPRTTAVTATAAPVAPIGYQERLRANGGLIAGVGVLLLAMLVGVLIGAGSRDDTQAATPPPPQVISVAGAGAAVPAAVGATGTTGAEDASASTSKRTKTKAAKSTKSTKDAASEVDDAKAPVAATNNAVKELDKLTGAAREKAVEKLGKTIPTGGKAPKKDSKPPAGGGSFEEIG